MHFSAKSWFFLKIFGYVYSVDSCTQYFSKQWTYRDPTFSLCQTVADGTGVDNVIV